MKVLNNDSQHNLTIINKAKYHISSQLMEYKNSSRHMMLKILVLAWDRHNNFTGFKPVYDSIKP